MQTRSGNGATHIANRLLYAATLRPLWALGSARQAEPPILISGSPRSGSTWLLETLERHFAARRNWEPVDGIEQHLGTPMGQRRFGLRPYISPGDTAHPLAPLLLDIVDGGSPRQWRRAWNGKAGALANLGRIAGARRTLVKFTEAQRCLPFIARHRSNQAVVILRNPLSVTASALTFGGKRDFTREPPPGPVPEPRRLPGGLLRDFPALEKYAGRDMTRAQYIGLSTCIDMLVPLRDPACRERYCFVAYETLKSGAADFGAVLRYLGESGGLSGEAADQLRQPSARARAVSALDGTRLDWEGRLSEQEVADVLEIASDLGIDWYGDAPGIDRAKAEQTGLACFVA
ncbi:MAG: hypothetical protein ACK4GD_05840 [Sphingomonadaceae bacterium]